MTQHVFTVYDAKAEAYLSPFVASTYGIAERMFTELVNTTDHTFNRHPADYTLYVCGQFDTHTAQINQTELKPIITGLAALKPSNTAVPISL